MVTVWAAGKVFRSIGLPIIFGELLGGIIVGPMVLGLIHPGSHIVEILAELGIFFLMLHSGLEADPHELFKSSKKSALIAIGGIIVPFVLGYMVAIAFGQPMVPALYIALCLSITAIAVAARLLKDYNIQKTRAGHITISAAIINDIIAFVLFSLIISLHHNGQVEPFEMLLLIGKILLFFGVVIFAGMKLSMHMDKALKNKGFTFALTVALGLGLFAEYIGLHMILGAFLAGLFVREEIVDPKVFRKIEDRIYGLSYGFLGPIFFTSLAFHLDFTAISTVPWFLGAILLVAVVGKLLGAGIPALLQKLSFHESVIVGLAMNNRGAVELIIASIGLEQGIINQDIFSILVVMTFATTLFAIVAMNPVVKHLRPKR